MRSAIARRILLAAVLLTSSCQQSAPPPPAELTPEQESQLEDQLKAAREAEEKAGHGKEPAHP